MIPLKKINNAIKAYMLTRSEKTLRRVLLFIAVIASVALLHIEIITNITNVFLIGITGVVLLLIYGLKIKEKTFQQFIDKYAVNAIILFFIILISNAGATSDFRAFLVTITSGILWYYSESILGFLTQFFPFSLFFQNRLFHAKNRLINESYELVTTIIQEIIPNSTITRIYHDKDHVQFFFTMKRGCSFTELQSKELIDTLSEEFGYATITETKEGKRILVPHISE